MSSTVIKKTDIINACDCYEEYVNGRYGKLLDAMVDEELAAIEKWKTRCYGLFYKPKTREQVRKYLIDSSPEYEDIYYYKRLQINKLDKFRHLCLGSHPHVIITTEDAWILTWIPR